MDASELDRELIDRVLSTARAHEPGSTAILVTGSYATGRATAGSDLDLRAITATPSTDYRTWFETRADGAPLHVSLGAGSAEDWQARAASPADWALGFPALTHARYLWSDPADPEPLGPDPSLRHPADTPELEDFVEALMKVRGAAADGDVLGVRWAAHAAGLLAPRLLIGLNAPRTVSTRRDALAAALELPTAPEAFSEQLTTCLGLNPARGGEVALTAAELGANLLAFLREHAPQVDAQPDLARYLADGTLERHLSGSD